MSATVGIFPKRLDTVTAEVLARLIQGEDMTGMNAVFSSNTTRLASVVHRLIHKYLWPIAAPEITVMTNDGRTAQVSAYELPSPSRVAAIGAEVGFCDSVKEARAEEGKEPTLSL